ncbi:MAG: serine hydrolase [Hellea sp.]|nr:serine hydrolase [Hellea sp.]
MRKLLIGLGLLIGMLLIFWAAIGPDWRRLIKNATTSKDVLFWSQSERHAGFRMMDRLPFLIKANTIAPGDEVSALPAGEPLPADIQALINSHMETTRVASLVILQDGKLRHEQYGLEFGPKGRWTSFSVAKSFTSTLVGAAIKDSHISSLDDKVSEYISGLKGSAYDDVTIEQLLTMSSGVQWNEDYSDPESDVALFNAQEPENGESSLVSYMRKLPRSHPPGEVWNYSTGETNLIGVLVREATGKTLAEYLSEKIWVPNGMEAKATWLLSPDGEEISGCCIQATTRDFARFGQFILDGAMINGESILPKGWIEQATFAHKQTQRGGHGYGYQWWTNPDGSYEASGIFGQGIFVDPSRNLVIASNSNWTSAIGSKDNEYAARSVFYQAVQAALD